MGTGRRRSVTKILYFAYGSNMLVKRLRQKSRAPSTTRLDVGYISGYRLTFDERSVDGSGKCDAEDTGLPDDRVYGVVYEINGTEKTLLDSAEGLGSGYAQKIMEVTSDHANYQAVTYCATEKDPSLKPYSWYKEYVLAGAREHRLPPEYLAMIEKVECTEDPDPIRCAKERAILSDRVRS